MAMTPSTMLPLGTKAPAFRLPDTDGRMVSLADYANAPVLLIAFICNHCPFVKHIQSAFVKLAQDYQAKGAAVLAINSNDAANYPDDSPRRMPAWGCACCRPGTEWVLPLEILFLDLGLLLSLYTGYRLAVAQSPRLVPALKALAPWAMLMVLLFAAGVWIVFQPMQMRGTL